MNNFRLSRRLCAEVGSFVQGSHATLDALFESAGAPGNPPNLSHHGKWKEWLFRVGTDKDVDSLSVLGNILEEFMDVAPIDDEARREWEVHRQRVVDALEAEGLRYFQGGRILPTGAHDSTPHAPDEPGRALRPTSIEELLKVLVNGLPRAMHPLTHRRKGAVNLSFSSEYDIQDLLHALLRPWVSDIRPEEFTPSYAGSSTRMDFLLPAHSLVIEMKLVRDKPHGRRVGDELIADIDHYRAHPNCSILWCVIYDPGRLIPNVGGLVRDLEGESPNQRGMVKTRVVVI